MLIPGTSPTFDLDRSGRAMRCVAAYIDHSATGIFGRPASENISIRVDAEFNFFLWLLRKDHSPVPVQRRCSQHRGKHRG